MKLLLGVLLIGVSATALAAPAPPGNVPPGNVIVLKCTLKHSVRRDPQHKPKPFTQHFRVDLDAKTVDGVRANITDDKIGWEPQQAYLRPYASLTLPDYAFHDMKYHGKTPDAITGACVKVE